MFDITSDAQCIFENIFHYIQCTNSETSIIRNTRYFEFGSVSLEFTILQNFKLPRRFKFCIHLSRYFEIENVSLEFRIIEVSLYYSTIENEVT